MRQDIYDNLVCLKEKADKGEVELDHEDKRWLEKMITSGRRNGKILFVDQTFYSCSNSTSLCSKQYEEFHQLYIIDKD